MHNTRSFQGFSKLDRTQRVRYLVDHGFLSKQEGATLDDYYPSATTDGQLFDRMIENYLTNYPVPMGIVPNLLVNGINYMVPYATEESSVIAAASKAAKYWASRGGFKAEVLSSAKKGQVHFIWKGLPATLVVHFEEITLQLLHDTTHLTAKMRKRGGGITGMELIDKSKELEGYFILDCTFETAESMGANFINSCLETMAASLTKLPVLNQEGQPPEVILAILSNYTPDCKVICKVECPTDEMAGWVPELSAVEFVRKFHLAVQMAHLEVSRAVTHNKGIFNGIDAVLLATGNDTRATAASAHAWAARDGNYRSLTSLHLGQGLFSYELELPLAIGTVGGITRIHPLVRQNMALLKHPNAGQLMMIAASAGLANNFSAVASLITTGIQKGHMRMHLHNILHQLQVAEEEQNTILSHFKEKTVSFAEVEQLIQEIRSQTIHRRS